MCGIAGVAVRRDTSINIEDDVAVRQMAATLEHRGPDGMSTHRDGSCVLGFTRLAIIDLETGQQPFSNPDGAVHALVNGEIFNHRELRTNDCAGYPWQGLSDCEVVLGMYETGGIDSLVKLRGMYGAAVIDHRERALYLIRDRMGIKPLFYWHDGERIIFASEIKALLNNPKCPSQFDWVTALSDPAINGHLAAPAGDPPAYFLGVQQVPAGHTIRFDLETGGLQIMRYWHATDRILSSFDGDGWEPSNAISAYANLLEEAVSDALMSDVEVGCFLSGGVDSSVVAAIAAQRGANVHCFSVLSESTLGNGDAHFAQRAADDLGLPHHHVDFRGPEAALSGTSYLELLRLCETPLLGPDQLFKFQLHRYAKQSRPNLKVMLTGQGSDECNGGYTPLFGNDWDSSLNSISYLADGRSALDSGIPFTAWNEHFGINLLNPEPFSRGSDSWNTYVNGKLRDLQTFNCWHEDRTASGNGIENRVPFLDHRLVELALSVPAPLRSRLLWDKHILREAARNWIPDHLAHRPKVAFFYGGKQHSAHQWMFEALRADKADLFEYAMASTGAQVYLNTGAMRTTFKALEADDKLANFEFFSRLVNMALLDQLASSSNRLDYHREAVDLDVLKRCTDQVTTPRSATVDRDATYVLASDVLALSPLAPSDGQEWYFLVNGAIEYTLPNAETESWRRTVAALNGTRSLAEALEESGANLRDVEDLLIQALDAGVMTQLVPQQNSSNGME